MKTPQTYRFHLGRNIRRTTGNPNMFFTITSTHTVELVTEDPDRTRHVILKNFPGWFVVCHEIVSQNVAVGPEAGRAISGNDWAATETKWSADDEKWQSEDPRR